MNGCQTYKVSHQYTTKHASKAPSWHTLEQAILLKLYKMFSFRPRDSLSQFWKLRHFLSTLSGLLCSQHMLLFNWDRVRLAQFWRCEKGCSLRG